MSWSKARRRLAWRLALIAVAVPLAFIARPAFHLVRTGWKDREEREALPAAEVDDASRMNRTPVAEVWPIPGGRAEAESQLAALLARARRDGSRVSIAGARHSMGGHTIYPQGIIVDMRPFRAMEFDEGARILRVQAGATWAEVIPFLDALGYSVAVMQSNNSFTVGGSISVNCHGWAYDQPPISSTVASLRLMKADGSIARCSRVENAELFSLALGGYGLLGVILDVELRVVPNERYKLEQFVVPVDEALATFEREVGKRQGVRMGYARMNVAPARLFDEVIINLFSLESSEPPPKLAPDELASLRRAVFRGSVGSDYGKELRWDAETHLQPLLGGTVCSRNQLLNEDVEVFENRSRGTTDILHEYFVPRLSVGRFVTLARDVIRRSGADLLNVTIRSVREDPDTVLRYADQDMLALVMLFNQKRSEEGERTMESLTRELIDSALSVGGRYYLQYRLHATRGQFHAAYPQAEEFFRKKRLHDPGEMFQNELYRRYGSMEADGGR